MWRTLIKFAVSALLIFVLLRTRDLKSLLDHILAVDRTELIAAAACYATVALPSALRWSIVVKTLNSYLPLRKALPIMLIGYFFNLTLVSSIGGDSVRMWKAYRAGLSARVAVSSVIIERLAQLLAHLLIVSASVPFLFYRVHDAVARTGVIALLAIGLAGFLVLMFLDRLPARIRTFRVFEAPAQFAKDMRRILLAPPTSIQTITLGFINQITTVAVVAILAAGLNLPIGFIDCLIVTPAAFLLTAIPVSIAGWGVREGAFVVGFSYLGLAAGDALALSLLFGLVNTVVRLPGMLVWLLMPDAVAPQAR
jgi:glycosyltransferase 2 family protein